MRVLVLVLVVALAGCAIPERPPPPPRLADFAIGSMSISTACASRNEPFTVELVVVNREARNGTATVIVSAQQFGYVVNEDVLLAAHESRALSFDASIEFAGVWSLYAIAPEVHADTATVKVVERGRSC